VGELPSGYLVWWDGSSRRFRWRAPWRDDGVGLAGHGAAYSREEAVAHALQYAELRASLDLGAQT